MLVFRGHSPYSIFRKKKLLHNLQKKAPNLSDIDANYIYLIQNDNLSKAELAKLVLIVDSTMTAWVENKENSRVFVTPRFGTISPWSSKATDILHVCGLSTITRIERGIVYTPSFTHISNVKDNLTTLLPDLHDRMTETCSFEIDSLMPVFANHEPRPNESIPLINGGIEKLAVANKKYGLALSEQELHYLAQRYNELGKDPTIAELMMFAQINSEHCRHKIFNGQWSIDGEKKEQSLFSMIRNTYACTKEGVLSAYKDNAAIIAGHESQNLLLDTVQHIYQYIEEPAHIVIKVETHNHPTAIAPFEGAATGSGGEIRDEGATGIGAKPKAGLTGFSVSNLHIPDLPRPWEQKITYPHYIASSLEVMLQGPIGAASFNNEFGRPNLCGYFRSFEVTEKSSETNIQVRGYHKPIMIAGGLGQIRPSAIQKESLPAGTKLIVLGGPAMLIGLGGGAASSLFSGSSHEALDFASVQRSNPEMERRCQEVINACWSLDNENPIISIHDVGAGGLSNALTELVHDSDKGALINLRAIPSADSSLNAMEIWCNEAQERYVLAINPINIPLFEKIAERERCPFAVVGEVNDSKSIEVHDSKLNDSPVKLPLDVLFGEASKLQIHVQTQSPNPHQSLKIDLPLQEIIQRILQLPTVADKSFLITIGDRTVTGLVARDQMVGPWQVPVSDVGVTASGYNNYTGEAMAMGERTPLALLNPVASARMAVSEAITNLIAASVEKLSDIKLSANWMAAMHYPEEESYLYQAVQEVAMNLCPALGICIPVGKDSLSMQMKWQDGARQYNVAAPLSLIISAFAPIQDIRKTLTPELQNSIHTELLLIDLGRGKNRLAGSALAQVIGQLGKTTPDLDQPEILIQFFQAVKALRDKNLLLAYHDRSDGGLLVSVCEMMFASHLGITLDLSPLGGDYFASLFSEELGAVIQYDKKFQSTVFDILEAHGLSQHSHPIAKINKSDQLVIYFNDKILFSESRTQLHRWWSQTSYHLQALRDNPDCATQEYDSLLDTANKGLNATLTFALPRTPPAIMGTKPKVVILREQGVNGHLEMAAAFDRAGFTAVDVHMTDILSGRIDLKQFQGLAAGGGFSYGDVLGAGRGWANSILFNERARDQFMTFFNSPAVFVLGVCNGCQMLAHLKSLIPGAEVWPKFVRNASEQFEARLSLVKIRKSPSIFFQGMEDSVIPIAISHGEGQVNFAQASDLAIALRDQLVPLQYVDNYHEVTEKYPSNPNGSVQGIAAVTNPDGRFTLMMPHAERVFRNVQLSWRPNEWQEENSPWFQLFINARKWLK